MQPTDTAPRRQICFVFKLLLLDFPDYARLSDMCCRFFHYYFNIAEKLFRQADSIATGGISDFCCHMSDSNSRSWRAAIAATNIHLFPNIFSAIELSMQGSHLASQTGTLFVYYIT